MNDLRSLATGQLELRAVAAEDVDDVYELYSDPRVWSHFPSGVHTARRQTSAQVRKFVDAWRHDGLGYWTARPHGAGFAGIGGCMVKADCAWNIYYRFRPEVHGRGYASELTAAAIRAARDLRPDLPACAFVLEHNTASRVVAEKCGLHLVWRGTDVGNSASGAIRLVYATRELTVGEVDRLIPKNDH